MKTFSSKNHLIEKKAKRAVLRAKPVPSATPDDKRPLITVFGSSRAVAGSELYKEGFQMGLSLAKAGFDVATGGYLGVMEAVSRGAHRGGAKVIGVSMKGFTDEINPYVMDEIPTANFYARFRWLVDRADGYVAMRGGMGTLAEMTFTWQKLWLNMLPVRPFVLLGHGWREILDVWLKNLTVEEGDYNCLEVADTPREACNFIVSSFASRNGFKLNGRPSAKSASFTNARL